MPDVLQGEPSEQDGKGREQLVDQEQQPTTQEDRQAAVHKHLNLDPASDQQNLFDLDHAQMEMLAHNAPEIDTTKKTPYDNGLDTNLPEGTVVKVKEKAGGNRELTHIGVLIKSEDPNTAPVIRLRYLYQEQIRDDGGSVWVSH